ncbi:hypothetical protein ACI2S0_24855 [Ralstonia nicotianae]
MNRPFLVRLADVVAFFAVTYLLLSLTTTLMMSFGKLPGPNNWIAMLVVGVIGIGCSIKILPIARGLVDLVLLPFRRAKE